MSIKTESHITPVKKSEVEIATSSPTGGNYAENGKHWKKNDQVVKHGGLLTVLFANDILFDRVPVIEIIHIDICKKVVKDGKTVPIPMANHPTSNDGKFTKLAGIATTGDAVKKGVTVPGCYYIKTPKTEYVGQSTHVGGRVRNHEILSRQPTKLGGTLHWLAGQAKNSTVTVFLLPAKDIDGFYKGLTLKQILALLELYLFCLIRPRANRTFVPDGGALHSAVSNKLISDLKSSMVYVYDITGSSPILVYRHLGQRQLCYALGVSKSWITGLKRETSGVYKKKYLFSTEIVDDVSTPTMTLEQLKTFVQLNKQKPRI